MRRGPHLLHHIAAQRALGDVLGVAPGPGDGGPRHGAVAGERELAAGPIGSLEHHPAD